MEFSKKIQKLRKENKLTQEELAQKLYISRTAISKWERGVGYPNIDSLKDIANLFNITIDELLSTEEIIDIAKKENNSNIKKTTNLIYGLLDIISILFIFLPIYAYKAENLIYSVSLFNVNDINNTIKILYIIILSILSLIGIFELILNFIDSKIQQRINILSLIFSSISVIFFIITRQTYLTTFIFILFIIKILIIIKNISNK